MKKTIYNIVIIILIGIIIGIGSYILFFNHEEKVVIDFKLNKNSLNIYVGESEKIDVIITPEDIDTLDITWKSSDSDIVSVTNDGIVKANNVGSAIITAKSIDDTSDSCIIHVEKKKNAIEFSNSNKDIIVGSKERLRVIINDDKLKNKTIKWSSNNEKIIKINDYGEIEAIKEGSTIITATIDNESASCNIKVLPLPKVSVSSIKLDKNDLLLIKGSKERLYTTISPADATEKKITWTSSNPSVVSIEDGEIVAKSPGEAIIKVVTVDGQKQAECKVKVVDIKTFNQQNDAISDYIKNTSNVRNTYTNNNCNKTRCDIPKEYKTSITGEVNIYLFNENSKTKNFLIKVKSSDINNYLIPNNTYYLESVSNKEIIELVKITGNIRMINISSIGNMRDLGGWLADNGVIKYGVLFRSANTNALKDLSQVSNLGIKKVIDLRPNSEINSSSAVESIRLRNPIEYYTIKKEVHNAVEKIMKLVVEENKNVLFNCNFGRDRTGTVAYIIEGLLGVSLENRKTDFELTYFYSPIRTRNDSAFKGLINQIEKYGKVNFEQEKFINWYLSFSNDKNNDLELINNFRSKLIDGSPHQYKILDDKLVLK